MFCLLKNNRVAKVLRTLPKAMIFPDGSSCGNFDLLDAEKKKEAGYYSYIDVRPSFDSNTQRLKELDVTISGTTVTTNYEIEDISITEQKIKRIKEIDDILKGKLKESVFEFDGEQFDFSQQVANDASQLLSVVEAGTPFPNGFSWTQRNRNEMAMDLEKFKLFTNKLAAHKLGIIGAAKYHIAMINNLTENIYNYNVNQGWGDVDISNNIL